MSDIIQPMDINYMYKRFYQSRNLGEKETAIVIQMTLTEPYDMYGIRLTVSGGITNLFRFTLCRTNNKEDSEEWTEIDHRDTYCREGRKVTHHLNNLLVYNIKQREMAMRADRNRASKDYAETIEALNNQFVNLSNAVRAMYGRSRYTNSGEVF